MAIEIDDDASHLPGHVSQVKHYDDLTKQNSMIHMGWAVYRWPVRIMQEQPERVKDSRGFGIDAPHTAGHSVAWDGGEVCQCDHAGRAEAHGPAVCTPLRRSGYRREGWEAARKASPLRC